MSIARPWISSILLACVVVSSAPADEIPGLASWRWDWRSAARSDWPNSTIISGNSATTRVPSADESWTWTAYSEQSPAPVSFSTSKSGTAKLSPVTTSTLSGTIPPSFTYVSAANNPAPVSAPAASRYASADSSNAFSISSISPAASGSAPAVDAFVNFGSGPYPGESWLTTGNARPWTESPVVSRVFGGTPSADQQQSFISDVVGRVEQIYHNQGIPLTLTTDPGTSASRTESVVSGTSYTGNSGAIGIASMGSSGFTFVDKFDPVTSLDELKKALSYNIAHELMHTFGVDHLDKSGNYLDAATASWDNLTKDGLLFSPEAVAALKNRGLGGNLPASGIGAELAFGRDDHGHECQHHYPAAQLCPLCEMGTTATPRAAAIVPAPVPEPSTILVWVGLVGAFGATRAIRSRRLAA